MACKSAIKKSRSEYIDETHEFIEHLYLLKYIDEVEMKALTIKYKRSRLEKISNQYFKLGHLDPEDINFSIDDFLNREALFTTNKYREDIKSYGQDSKK